MQSTTMNNVFRRTLVLLVLLTVGPFAGVWAAEGGMKGVAARALPAVVTISTYGEGGKPSGMGSGFVLTANGLVATNYHVVHGADAAKVHLHSGDVYRVEGIVEVDGEKDIAILKINAVELPRMKLGDSNRVSPAETVIALGSPSGLEGTVTVGNVSQVRRREGYSVIQHTAAISAGSSGGPLLNEEGEVIGVNTALLKDVNSAYFALPVNYLRAMLDNTDGRSVALSTLRRETARARNAEPAAEFDAYEDPDGLFKLRLPWSWRVQRSEHADSENGYTRHVLFMAHSRTAEQARLKGWLSDGLRVHLRFPEKGKEWNLEWAKKWAVTVFEAALKGYDKAAPADPQEIRLGEVSGAGVVILGASRNVSKPEAKLLVVVFHPKCLMVVELVGPADKVENLKEMEGILRDSFQASWAG